MRTRIKEYRARHGLTQEKLAEMVGVRRETIIFLEQGKYNSSLRMTHNIARVLQAGIDELFIFDEDGGRLNVLPRSGCRRRCCYPRHRCCRYPRSFCPWCGAYRLPTYP